ncbi:MAG: aromatic ring-hydroxylating dioxygenase subunit alpha [Leptolyngbyaceae cyanobacterium bins.302]|nr:aromatic ring-hydroxylating dioxygenase subunit alpha [Leptolyngbyaceae cyanobacterium bins.302]
MNTPVTASDTTASNTTTQRFDVRRAGINPNLWYVVAQAKEVRDHPVGITLWHQEIVLYRDTQGQVHALEDRCPHRFVKLSRGAVVGDDLECAYHGWRVGTEGQCTCVPYLEANQKLPTGKIRRYPVQELDGFIWLYPGDIEVLEKDAIQPMGLPEWDHLNYIASFTVIEAEAHFSYLIENLMDMYHGHLHQDLQAWASAELRSINETSDRVDAHYTAQSYYRIDKIWSVSQLFFPALRRLHPEPLDVSYAYPNWASSLGKDFKIYCLFCPVSETHTRAYLVHFTSLNAFHHLHKLPIAFRRFVKNRMFNAARKLLQGLVDQDVPMIEDEQKAYLENPDRRPHEFNRALVSVQRLIRVQAEKGL